MHLAPHFKPPLNADAPFLPQFSAPKSAFKPHSRGFPQTKRDFRNPEKSIAATGSLNDPTKIIAERTRNTPNFQISRKQPSDAMVDAQKDVPYKSALVESLVRS
jgi:hypothetical protein